MGPDYAAAKLQGNNLSNFIYHQVIETTKRKRNKIKHYTLQ